MTVIDFQQRKEQISARGEQYRAGQISEAAFRASLMSMGLRRDDIDVMASENSPMVRRGHEQQRYEDSLQWLRDYLADQRGRHR